MSENPKGLIYLASPYSDADASVREDRFNRVCREAARLMQVGVNIFSPIAHTHPIALYGLPKGWEFWEKYDRLYLEACTELWVLMLEGWMRSKGVAGEIAIMRELEKPVKYVKEHTLEVTVESKDV